MESFNLDISLDYTEEFNFGSRLSSASSARSFSTASSRAPITPQSGRSTPQQCVPSMSLKSLAEYEFTSPNNSMDDYFSTDIKGEFPVCDIISLTPAKKTTASQYTMDVDQTTFMTPNPSSYGNVMDFNPQSFLEPLPFSDPMNLSPFAGSSTPYSINDHPGNSPSLWSCQFENPLEYLTRTESPAFTSPLGDYALQDRSTPLPSSHPRRSASMQNTRDKTSLSHQVQSDPRDLKQPSCLELEQLGIKTEEPGKFACDMPKCIKQAKKYQRMEHLKRHWNNDHGNPERFMCEFCPRVFSGRKDNYKSHLKLHDDPNKSSTSRTTYDPRAAIRLAELEATTKRKNTRRRTPKA